MLDIDQSNLSEILNGKRKINASFAFKLEKAMLITLLRGWAYLIDVPY